MLEKTIQDNEIILLEEALKFMSTLVYAKIKSAARTNRTKTHAKLINQQL